MLFPQGFCNGFVRFAAGFGIPFGEWRGREVDGGTPMLGYDVDAQSRL